ncbi:MAG: acetyl-CoA carboxylase biotin carboxyl carrier protein [Acidobacteriota bacterium]
MTFEQIKELIDQVAGHGLSGIELERSGFRLKIDGHQTVNVSTAEPIAAAPPVVVQSAAAASPASAPAVAAPPAAEPAAPAADADEPPPGSHILNSPIVGTFYRAPNPDSPAFAEVGDRVSTGQVLCIVEAMKLMNEIESDVAGEVVKVYVENAQPVEYGEPLFAIKPA